MALDELNPTDELILRMLAEGRCTPAYIAEAGETTRQNVQNRLNVLLAADYAERIHTGLYEITEAGRERIEG